MADHHIAGCTGKIPYLFRADAKEAARRQGNARAFGGAARRLHVYRCEIEGGCGKFHLSTYNGSRAEMAERRPQRFDLGQPAVVVARRHG